MPTSCSVILTQELNLKSQHEPPDNRQHIFKSRNRQSCRDNSMPTAKPLDGCITDPEPDMERGKPRSAICVQSVDAHMSCSSHFDTQLAAFFIDPRAK